MADSNLDPLVSVYLFCKDRADSIRHCIDSVLRQTYQNLEFIIQDGASTDGTLEIIKSYSDPRIKLVSEPDAGPAEGFWKALNRCEGDIIASCLSDEELLPHAVEEAVRIFANHPKLGAITRDGYITDEKGQITAEFIAGEFDFVDYLFGRYCPMWVASFFRRQALLDIGLQDGAWTIGCLEFEIWCRLATDHWVKYFPGIVAKYGVNETQLSNTPKNFLDHLDNRTKLVHHLFSKNGFFGHDPVKRAACLYNQNYLFYNHARAYKIFDQVQLIYQRILDVVRDLGPIEKLELGNTTFIEVDAPSRVRGMVNERWYVLSVYTPRFIKKAFTPAQRATIRRWGMAMFTWLYNYILPPRAHYAEKRAQRIMRERALSLEAPTYSKTLYHDVAMLFYGRGRIDQALQLWRKAEDLNDITIDSLAVQAALLSPTATSEALLQYQKEWAARHAKPIEDLPPLERRPFKRDGEIRVGYHCSFYDGYVLRAMFSPVAAYHDRDKVTAIAYSISSAPHDIENAFDSFRVVGTMSDKEFVELVRKDEIDIFIEMSGFSPRHRFSAMASRCAPIQISYFNHSGTSGVPNVDYVLADAMAVSADEEKFFTEKIWRVDDQMLFFNYEWAGLPEPGPPPCHRNGYVTFGCFGSSGKVCDELVALWAQLLHRVPESRFYIRHSGLGLAANRDFMRKRFARHGIPEERLWLDGASDWHDFIKSYEHVDISMDTWPYCGANTIGESVWQGVPVVTLRGERFSSCYGSSLVNAAGCPELIAETPDQYIDIAAVLAGDTERISHYRKNLRRMAVEHGLSDPQRFARKLQKAYAEMIALLEQTYLSQSSPKIPPSVREHGTMIRRHT